MDIANFNYHLPPELISQKAIEPRDSCKLLVLNRKTGQVSHLVFRDLDKLLNPNTVLVLNDTKVFPARLYGTKTTGGKTEVLLIKQINTQAFQAIGTGKLKPGQGIDFGHGLSGSIQQKDLDSTFILNFNLSGVELCSKIDELGKTPLPPYIHSQVDEEVLRQQYQTVYAGEQGSAAAPTAGLHFTHSLLSQLIQGGVQIEKITLHVGLGTFKPVTEDQVAKKSLHSESYHVAHDVAQRLNQAKADGKKIIAVGTTTCRVLETISDNSSVLHPGMGETNLFIQPGDQFKFVDGLITNFHLPQTSLLMLVSAFVCFPNSPTHFENFSDSPIGRAYAEAIANRYRFFSFGDAMFIV